MFDRFTDELIEQCVCGYKRNRETTKQPELFDLCNQSQRPAWAFVIIPLKHCDMLRLNKELQRFLKLTVLKKGREKEILRKRERERKKERKRVRERASERDR